MWTTQRAWWSRQGRRNRDVPHPRTSRAPGSSVMQVGAQTSTGGHSRRHPPHRGTLSPSVGPLRLARRGHPSARGTMQGYSWWGAERDIGWRRVRRDERSRAGGSTAAAVRTAPTAQISYSARTWHPRERGPPPTRWMSADEEQRLGPTGRRLKMTGGASGRPPCTALTPSVTPLPNEHSVSHNRPSGVVGKHRRWVPCTRATTVVTAHRRGGCVVRSPSVPPMGGAPLRAVGSQRAHTATATHRILQRGQLRGGPAHRSGASPATGARGAGG